MRREASFADARSRFGTAKPVDLVASGDPFEAPDPFVELACWRELLFLVAASGEGSGGFILILRGVRGGWDRLISTDITLRIIPSRYTWPALDMALETVSMVVVLTHIAFRRVVEKHTS